MEKTLDRAHFYFILTIGFVATGVYVGYNLCEKYNNLVPFLQYHFPESFVSFLTTLTENSNAAIGGFLGAIVVGWFPFVMMIWHLFLSGLYQVSRSVKNVEG
jgi:hypothetical protein